MSKQVTLKDVAAKAGVSYQTVSKVLNGKANVAPETEEQIWKVIEELDYRTNVAGRNLRKQASQLIGYTWSPAPPDRPNPILDGFLSSTVAAAAEKGYHLLLFPTHAAEDEFAIYRNLVRSGRVDGFIVASTNYDDERIQFLRDADFPFVAFGRSNVDWSFDYVDVDGSAGLELATGHLIAQGHHRIGLLGWEGYSPAGNDRESGYRAAMSVANLSIDDRLVHHVAGSVATGYATTSALLALPSEQRPTAIAAVDDQLAIGAMRAAQDAGLLVGHDFGVTGFDDTPGIQHLRPPLTSLRQPIADVGEAIVDCLVAIIEGREQGPTAITLPPKLIVRESSLRNV